MQTMEYHTAMTKKFSSPDRKRDLRQHWLCEKSKLHNKNLTCEHFEWHVKVHMGHPWEAGPRGTSVFYKTCFSPLFGFSQWALIIFCIQKKKMKDFWKVSTYYESALWVPESFTFLNHLEEIFFTPYSKEEKLTQSGVKHHGQSPPARSDRAGL